jgi:hypothetical protein
VGSPLRGTSTDRAPRIEANVTKNIAADEGCAASSVLPRKKRKPGIYAGRPPHELPIALVPFVTWRSNRQIGFKFQVQPECS